MYGTTILVSDIIMGKKYYSSALFLEKTDKIEYFFKKIFLLENLIETLLENILENNSKKALFLFRIRLSCKKERKKMKKGKTKLRKRLI